MRTFGAVVLLLAVMLPWRAAAQQPCPTLVVSNTNDTVNGTTSSPCALIANPGPDGISLREAVMAADNATGLGTITITFAAALAGQTIAPSSSNGCCYIISRDSVAIAGLTDMNGAPSVTVDATNMFILFSVTASNFTLTSMRIVGMGAASPGAKTGVYVRAGDTPGKLQVSDTVITGNVFSNNPGQASGIAVVVGAAFNAAPNAVFSNAVIANNTFTNFTNIGSGGTDAVKLQAEGTNSTVQNVSISQNTFTTVTYPIELVPAFSSGGRILNTRIVANSFSSGQTPVIIDPSGDDGQPSTGNTVDGTTIERNVFTGNIGPAIMLIGGIGNGTTVSAIGNAITNTRIVNNLIAGDTTYGGISISGGRQQSSGNSVSNVNIVNNTIVNYSGCSSCGGAIDVNSNLMGGTNNTVSGVTVLNTILWNNTPLDFFGVVASQVTTSITAQSGFAGVDGNLGSNPQFVNSGSGDFHLQPGSPAIGAGTAAGAPFGDLECKVRASPPAIGTYESGNNPSCTEIVPVAAVLPSSRSVEIDTAATAFATIVNTGSVTANACGLVPPTSVPASFIFQTTDPATNTVNGTPNTPVSIAAGATQTYVFGFLPTAAMAPTNVALEFTCANTLDVATLVGINTLLTSFSSTPVPDMIAVGLTSSNDGYSHTGGTSGTGIFVIAATNIGASGELTAQVALSNSTMPLTATVCQTNPSTGQCLASPAASVTTTINQNQNTTWTAFLTASGPIQQDPASNRVYFEFVDSNGIVRGSTSTAVTTQ